MKYDLSFIPSYECNLSCWFCMYDGGPGQMKRLSIKKVKSFLSGVTFSEINSFGFYGGEISINLPLYKSFIELTPEYIPRFVITNGSWSSDLNKAYEFIMFVIVNKLRVKVSRTPEHRKYQNAANLKWACDLVKGQIYIKKNDDTKAKLLPMGRLSNQPFSCNYECRKLTHFPRLAMTPFGKIIFQSCKGVYPEIGSWTDSWSFIKAQIKRIMEEGCVARMKYNIYPVERERCFLEK